MFKVKHISAYLTPCSSLPIVNVEHAAAGWNGIFNKKSKLCFSLVVPIKLLIHIK